MRALNSLPPFMQADLQPEAFARIILKGLTCNPALAPIPVIGTPSALVNGENQKRAATLRERQLAIIHRLGISERILESL